MTTDKFQFLFFVNFWENEGICETFRFSENGESAFFGFGERLFRHRRDEVQPLFIIKIAFSRVRARPKINIDIIFHCGLTLGCAFSD